MERIKSNTSKVPKMIVDMMGDHFLEVARHLRETQKNHPEDFRSVAKQLKIGIRKAYNLAQISRTFEDLEVPIERLRRLGWTKLALLSPYVNKRNIDRLLAKAADATAHELKMYLRGNEFDPDGRTIVLHLTSEQYAVFERALLAAGAIPHSRGLLDKEAVLTRLLDRVVSN